MYWLFCHRFVEARRRTSEHAKVLMKLDEKLIRQHLGIHIHEFIAGNFTDEIKMIIGKARQEYGPTTNDKFVGFFRLNLSRQDMADPQWIDKMCFEIRNIQPIA